LVVDAALELAEATVPIPATGDLERDFYQLAFVIAAALGDLRHRRLIAGLVAARAEDPELNDLISQFWAARFGSVTEILHRADGVHDQSLARVEAVMEVLIAPMYFRTLITGTPIDDRLIQKCAHDAAAAARSPADP